MSVHNMKYVHKHDIYITTEIKSDCGLLNGYIVNNVKLLVFYLFK